MLVEGRYVREKRPEIGARYERKVYREYSMEELDWQENFLRETQMVLPEALRMWQVYAWVAAASVVVVIVVSLGE